jgi:hypothetical protein
MGGGVVTVLAVLTIAAPASAAGTKVDVLWEAGGTYTLDAVADNGAGCSFSAHFTANISSKLTSSFTIPDGNRSAMHQPAEVQNPLGTGSLHGDSGIATDGGCQQSFPYECPAHPWVANDPAIDVGAGGGGPIAIGIMPAARIGNHTNPCSSDPDDAAGYDAVTADQLNDYLPTALEAKLDFNEQELRDAGEVTQSVVLDNATTGLPPDCSEAFKGRIGASNGVCTQEISLNVNVTLKIADGCPVGTKPSGERCLTEKQKDDYATAAGNAMARGNFLKCSKAQRKRYGGPTCDAFNQSAKVTGQIVNMYMKLAADPPDPNFDAAVHVHVAEIDDLGQGAGAFDDFREADARFEGLLEALLHSLEKGAGAAAAGDQTWLARHNAETQRFASKALDALQDRSKAAKGAIREFKGGLGPMRVAKTLMGDDLEAETDIAVAALTPTASG